MDSVGSSLLDWYRAENERLRAALDLIANWSSRTADEHGHVGVREFARQVIAPNHPLGIDGCPSPKSEG